MKSKQFLKISFALVMFITFFNATAQQGTAINTSGAAADASAILDVSSTSQGLLIPRMTASERGAVSGPAEGLMVYQTDAVKGFYYYTGAAWTYIGGDNLGNHTAGDSLDMANYKIKNLATCTENYDAANKLYVDNTVAAGGGGGGGHYIGESYQGGIIYWIDETGLHGLIANATDNISASVWCDVTTAIGENAQHIDDGAANAPYILATCANSAAKVCDTSTAGSYTDWYLPASYELQLLQYVVKKIGGFYSAYYWTSTEYTLSQNSAHFIDFMSGFNYTNTAVGPCKAGKTSANRVRCIRKF